MSKYRNSQTGVVISVDDSKDDRYGPGSGWVPADSEPARADDLAEAESAESAEAESAESDVNPAAKRAPRRKSS